METSSKVNGLPQAASRSESVRLVDPRVPPEATERRSPHRVISTASYYHPERRRRVFGDGFDEFPEGPDTGEEMDGASGGSFN